MSEENKNDKHTICSKCKCKYINDEEHISTDFGYTRLEERYKTCVKCRAKKIVHSKTYYEKHKEQMREHSKKYHEEPKEQIREPHTPKVICKCCGKEMNKQQLARHHKSKFCKNGNDRYRYKKDADSELKDCNQCKRHYHQIIIIFTHMVTILNCVKRMCRLCH